MISYAQCDFDGDIDIPDESSITVDLIVSGAEQNILGVNNCLKSVNIHFDHDFISDLTVGLISPSGDSITLVGFAPANQSSSTSLVLSWDIQFVNRDELVAMPDPDHDEVWDSYPFPLGWLAFNTFTGSYYPYDGALEDLSGPVNGVWKVILSDNVQFSDGSLFCLGFEFCDEQGVEIASCDPVESTFASADVTACRGDQSLILDASPTLGMEYDSTIYGYQHLLFSDDMYGIQISAFDFTNFPAGDYSICGISYLLADQSEIDNLPQDSSKVAIQKHLGDESICARLSSDCIEVTILPVPASVTDKRTICAGDVVTIGTENYGATGIYTITTPLSPCDSVSILDLTVISLDVVITSDVPQLDCSNRVVTLSGMDSEVPTGATFGWSTADGSFASGTGGIVTTVDRGGTYTFTVTDGACIFSEDLTIVEADDFVVFDFDVQNITCTRDSALIDLSTSDGLDIVDWSSPASFRQIDEDILVGTEGTYSVTFMTEFGCEIQRDIFVDDVSVFPDFTLQGNTITCLEPEVTLTTTTPDIYNSTFTWLTNNELFGSGRSIQTDSAGLYILRVTTGQGCVDSFEIQILSTYEELDASLIGGDLGCELTELEIGYSSSFGGLSVLWTLPDMTTLVDSNFVSDLAGTYDLHLEDDKGCTLDTSLTVAQSNALPQLDVLPALFTCGEDSIQIFSQLIADGPVDYLWSNAGGFSDTSSVPWVRSPGEYYVETCFANGCCDIDTFRVAVDIEVPDVNFDFQNLSCVVDTSYIIPSDTSSFDMTWSLNGSVISVDSNIIQVVDSGFYEVVVLNPANGCSSTYSFDIKQDTVSQINDLSANIINCVDKTVRLRVDSDRDFAAFIWSGPGLLDNSIEPLVNLAGEYILDYTLVNGCTSIDTITVESEGELPMLTGRDTVFNCFAPALDLTVGHASTMISITWVGPNFQGQGETVTISEPGLYNVFAVSPGACRDTMQIEVVADTISPVISLVNDGIITCADSIVDLTITADINANIAWFPPNPGIISQVGQVAQVDLPGTYLAFAVALNGCRDTASTIVMISNDFPEYSINLDSLDCANDQILVGFTSPDPALSVDWIGPTLVPDDTYDFVADQTGTYEFTLTNSDGCVVSDSLVIFMDTVPPQTEIVLSNQINCTFDEVTLSVADPISSWDIVWSGAGVTDSSTDQFITDEVGDYLLTVTALNGCVTNDNMTVLYDTSGAEIVVLGDPITCTTGKVFLRVTTESDIMQYQWEGPSGFTSSLIEPLVQEIGTYTVTVTSVNGCVSQGEVTVEDEREFPTIDVPDFYLPCDGAPALATYSEISDGAQTRWFGPNGFFVVADTAAILIEGEYFAVAFSSEGCSTSDTFLVIDEAILPIFDGVDNSLLCFGPEELLAVDVDDDRSLVWTRPDGFSSQVNPLMTETPGIYTLIVTGTNGCVDSTTVELVDGRVYPDIEIQGNSLFQCENTQVTLSSNGSSVGSQYVYQWRTQGGNILAGVNGTAPRIESEGIYILRITDLDIGCVSEDSIMLTLNDQDFTELVLELVPPSCAQYENGSIVITEFIGGYGPFDVTLDGDDYGDRMDVLYLSEGEHLLSIVDSLGCVVDTVVNLDMRNPLEIALLSDTTLVFGQSLTVPVEISISADSIDQIIWSDNVPCNGCTSFDFIPSGNMTIGVTVIDINGCEVYQEFRLTVNRPNNLPFPQIFSPNGDGVNDMFYMPMTTGLQVIDYLKIYDNWGGLLYDGRDLIPGDPTRGWDGTVNGRQAEMAVYIVEARVTLTDGKTVSYIGDVTLMR